MFITTQNSMSCPALIDLLANIRKKEIMCLQKTPNSTPSIATMAYKNKRSNYRGQNSKPWIRIAPNTRPGGMRLNIIVTHIM